jgi:hypothetical protein
MKVKQLTPAQARNLHKRFGGYYVVKPFPLKNGNWAITENELLGLKEWFIDKMVSGEIPDKPAVRTKATALWNNLKDDPTYDTEDFPQLMYATEIDLDNATVEELAEQEERKTRNAELVFEEVN